MEYNHEPAVSRVVERPNNLLMQYADYLRETHLLPEDDYKDWKEFLENKYGISKPTEEVE